MYLVLQRRLNLKMQKKVLKNDDSRDLLSSIDSVMKWILVSCFGYLGFKNARWGSLEITSKCYSISSPLFNDC